MSGQTYTVNRSTDVDQSDPWASVQSGIAGTGGTVMVDDLNVLSGNRKIFYQVVTMLP